MSKYGRPKKIARFLEQELISRNFQMVSSLFFKTKFQSYEIFDRYCYIYPIMLVDWKFLLNGYSNTSCCNNAVLLSAKQTSKPLLFCYHLCTAITLLVLLWELPVLSYLDIAFLIKNLGHCCTQCSYNYNYNYVIIFPLLNVDF